MAISKIENSSLASGVPGRSSLPAGTVLQVVNATYSTTTDISTSTWTDTGLTASITPTSSSSKILVIASCDIYKYSTNTAGQLQILRGASSIYFFPGSIGETGTTANNGVGVSSVSYLDSPATTSSTTYKLQIKSQSNSNYIRYCADGGKISMTLMEIAA